MKELENDGHFEKAVREGLTEEVTFHQGPERVWGTA